MLKEEDLFNKEETAMDSAIKMAQKASKAASNSVKSIPSSKPKTPSKTKKQRRTKKEKKEAETMGQEDTLMKQKSPKKTRAKKGEPKKKKIDKRIGKRVRTTKSLPPLIPEPYSKYLEAVKIRRIKIKDIEGYEEDFVKAFGPKANNWKHIDIYAARFKDWRNWKDASESLEDWDIAEPELDYQVPLKKIYIKGVYPAGSGTQEVVEYYNCQTMRYNCGTFGRWMAYGETVRPLYKHFNKTDFDDISDLVIPIAGGFFGLEYVHHKAGNKFRINNRFVKKIDGKYRNQLLIETGVRERPLPHPCLIVVNPEYNKVLIKFRQWDQITTSYGIKVMKEFLYSFNYHTKGDNFDIINEDILHYYDLVFRQQPHSIKESFDQLKDEMVYFSDEEED